MSALASSAAAICAVTVRPLRGGHSVSFRDSAAAHGAAAARGSAAQERAADDRAATERVTAVRDAAADGVRLVPSDEPGADQRGRSVATAARQRPSLDAAVRRRDDDDVHGRPRSVTHG